MTSTRSHHHPTSLSPQERLIQLVAGVLLDRNDDARLEAAGADAGARANAAANVGAAVAALPKLATGIDVNVRFSGPAAFEFTDEVAIFDLLGLPLLHGWVVSGEDEAACVVANLTYNQPPSWRCRWRMGMMARARLAWWLRRRRHHPQHPRPPPTPPLVSAPCRRLTWRPLWRQTCG